MYLMSVVRKSTCSGFKTGFYIYCHGGNAFGYIKQKSYFLKDGRISGYFDAKHMTVFRIEPILHNFEDQKNRSIFAWHSSLIHLMIFIECALDRAYLSSNHYFCYNMQQALMQSVTGNYSFIYKHKPGLMDTLIHK